MAFKVKLTQRERVLKRLKQARGGWVDGMEFLRMDPPITQYHARMWHLKKDGYEIEGRFIDGKTWKEYRIPSKKNKAQ